jgi:hypothetical protein
MTLLLLIVCAVLAVKMYQLSRLREVCEELRIIETRCVSTKAQEEVDTQNEVIKRIRELR